MYIPPGMAKGYHGLLLALATFECPPSAEELSQATGYKLTTTEAYLRAMNRAGLVDVSRHEDECGQLLLTYHLTGAGAQMFDDIVTADAALKRLARRRRSARRAIDRRALRKSKT